MSVSDLPTETIVKVFHYLDVLETLHCRQVCRRFCTVIDHTESVQYWIELLICGVDDHGNGFSAASSISERRSALQLYHQAWNRLSWSADATISPPCTESMVLRLCKGGIVAFLGDNDQWNFFRLPSLTRNIKPKTWFIPRQTQMDFVHSNSFDALPSQDLFISGERLPRPRVIFLSLSTGLPHPNASNAVITFEEGIHRNNIEAIPDVSSHLVSLTSGFTTDGSNRFRVLDWTDGQINLDVTTATRVSAGAYLAADMYMIACLEGKRVLLSVYKLNCSNPGISLKLCGFAFPDQQDGCSIWHLNLFSGHRDKSLDNDIEAPFFQPTDRNCIFALRFDSRSQNESVRRHFALFFSCSSMVKMVHMSVPGRVWEWGEWGPMNTRFTEDALVSTCGMRATVVVGFDEDHDLEVIRYSLFDFNQLTLHSNTSDQSSFEYVETPSTLPEEYFDVSLAHRTTCLPYRSAMMVDPAQINHPLLFEDGILAWHAIHDPGKNPIDYFEIHFQSI